MSEGRYYWLKLKEDFFDDDTMSWIEDQPGGEKYILFYLKLCLKSLKGNGCLSRCVGEKIMPYDVPALARLTNTDKDTVAVALKAFESIGLVSIRGTGEIYMNQINEMVGSETRQAAIMRRKRALADAEKSNIVTEKSNIVNNGCNIVTEKSNIVRKCYTEYRDKSIELEIEKEIEKEEASPVGKCPDKCLDDRPPLPVGRAQKSRAVQCPDNVDKDVWRDFVALRKAKKAPLTATALKGIVREAGKAGISLQRVLEVCAARGWQSFRAEWDWGDNGSGEGAAKDYSRIDYGESGLL